jgi:hypothetical protein
MQARTRVSPSSMVQSVTYLAIQVRFRIRNDLKMIPSVLRCIPNVENLDIMVKPLTLLLAFILYNHVLA